MRHRRTTTARGYRLWPASVALLCVACSSEGTAPGFDDGLVPSGVCSLDERFLADTGIGRDGIPALSDPDFVGLEEEIEVRYILPHDRVVGLIIADQPYAIPHNILWWHEIVNLNIGSVEVAVSYCPLTGSAMAFDRKSVEGDEFGVSGLLYQNNLVMYNRRTNESLWPQMAGGARCGPQSGRELERFSSFEMQWSRWTELYPNTRVVSSDTGAFRDYTAYPYGDYEALTSGYDYPMPTLDGRRPPKERVLAVPGDDPVAVPFGELAVLGAWGAVELAVAGDTVVVIWDEQARAAVAFWPFAGGARVHLSGTPEGLIDLETGSVWSIDGVARSGPSEGATLLPWAPAYVAFWGAWAAFNPETRLWTAE